MLSYIIFSAVLALTSSAAINTSYVDEMETDHGNIIMLEPEQNNVTTMEPEHYNITLTEAMDENLTTIEPVHNNITTVKPEHDNITLMESDLENTTMLEPIILPTPHRHSDETDIVRPISPVAVDQDVDITKCPSTVVIQRQVNDDWSFHCAGSLVAPNKVLTSATCAQIETKRYWFVHKVDSYRVLLGSDSYKLEPGTQTQVIFVTGIYIHPKFQSKITSTNGLFTDDLAVFTLASDAELSERVQTIELSDTDQHLAGQTCIVAGFKFRGTNVGFNMLHLPVIDKRTCQTAFEAKAELKRVLIKPVHLCTLDPVGLQAPCIGDAGSALICGGRLFGVLSTIDVNCVFAPQRSLPATFMSVACYRPFLNFMIAL